MGLARAGYTVVGFDQKPQPHYPFEFILGDALEVELPDADLIWASPPCQAFSSLGILHPDIEYPDLVEPVRARLAERDCPTIIENVVGAPLRIDVKLCGSQFGLTLQRHRIFELSYPPPLVMPCDHSLPTTGVYGHTGLGSNRGGDRDNPLKIPATAENWRKAMGIDWMTTAELSQAIPPAYSEFLARAVPVTVQPK